MDIKVFADESELGMAAAALAAEIINKAIQEQGGARIVLSTGASQFAFFEALVRQAIDWTKVEMFHLDEYVDLPTGHPASFRKYLTERFTQQVPVGKVHWVSGEGDVERTIRELSEEVTKAPVDLAMVGIGENAHIAFNDPPADFDTEQPYLVVDLNESCKRQQVGEGWFGSVEEVPKQAITMSVHRILQSKVILSCVPHQVKARAVRLTLASPVTNEIPATKLKEHPQWTLFLDEASASEASGDLHTV